MNLSVFIAALIGRIYKILPLKEEENDSLSLYLQSLAMEMDGALSTFPILGNSQEYIAVFNTIQYFLKSDADVKVYHREVFKMIGLLNIASKKIGGGRID